MSRSPRTVIPGIPHHVILRGNNRRRLFSFPRDYLGFVNLLLGASLDVPCLVHALCLMSNHVHLLVSPEQSDALACFVKFVAQRYARRRNDMRAGSGKLFEERYKSVPIASERQLAIATAYIDLNPVRAGLVREPADYRWSTFRLHGGQLSRSVIPPQLWTPSSWYTALGNNSADRAASYIAFVETCRIDEARPEWAPEAGDPSSRRDWRRHERPDGTSVT